MRMLVFYKAGNQPIECEVIKLMSGVGEYDCIECGGTGVFRGHPVDEFECVSCKGTGRLLVSI